MKNHFVKLAPLAMLLIFNSVSVLAADYYVVVGAFAEEANAQKFAEGVKPTFKEVTYSYNEHRKLYYVHVLKTSRKEEARNWVVYLRREKGFRDAWVMSYQNGKNTSVGEEAPNDVSTLVKRNVSSPHQPRYASGDTGGNERRNSVLHISDDLEASSSRSNVVALKTRRDADISWTVNGDLQFATVVSSMQGIRDNTAFASSQMFTFVVEGAEGKELSSEVMLVDFENVKKIAGVRSGEHLAIKPTKRNQMVTFVCDVLGYSMETRMFNIEHLSRGRDVRQREDGVWEVRFKLRKLKVDEVSFLNKTTFYPDAAVLQPSSEAEMNDLVVMMQSNPGYKIVIHSHCNPSGRRQISLPADKKYFDLEGAIEKAGSDRHLTRHRAETVRKYLLDHGIDKKRIGIVGWGSADMLVDSSAPDAYINDRVEIELVAE